MDNPSTWDWDCLWWNRVVGGRHRVIDLWWHLWVPLWITLGVTLRNSLGDSLRDSLGYPLLWIVVDLWRWRGGRGHCGHRSLLWRVSHLRRRSLGYSLGHCRHCCRDRWLNLAGNLGYVVSNLLKAVFHCFVGDLKEFINSFLV